VAVAGVDRLLLSAPLAVQDLLAAARFAVQPLDDLNLASLLVSPLVGWRQDELYRVAHDRQGNLWEAVRAAGPAPESLRTILDMADYATPHGFFETILSGPIDGRRRLLERLGTEARDPIEALLAAALEFEAGTAPSLQRFLDWFSRGDVEVVRDAGEGGNAVRVMTVHGSKGLQSPVVVLADACVDPNRSRGGVASFSSDEISPPIPLFRPRKDEMAEPLQSQIERQDRLDREEHWRLLYVALTRAEERLYIGGALGPADRKGPPEESWYAALERSMEGLGAVPAEDALWGSARVFGEAPVPAAAGPRAADRPLALPAWLRIGAPLEARPPRPLAPSALGDDDVASPPPTPQTRQAAERGRLLHQLFERLPGVAPGERAARADAWLERSAGVTDAALRSALVEDACAILSHPDYAAIFTADALAEAPIAAATPDGSVISGTVDRLLVSESLVRLVDFKTGRAVPATPSEIPAAHLRQMAAYVAALEIIFPDRAVEAALLYTAGPLLHPLPNALLAPYRPQAALLAG
jgi:ATP-dependent helicase/nuclease subunit A